MTFWEFRPIVESNGRIAWKLLQALAKQLREADAPRLLPKAARPSATRSSRGRGRVARERDRLDARERLVDAAAEDDAADARRGSAARPRRAPSRVRRRVDAPLAGDDEVVTRGSKPSASRTSVRAGDELGAERRERGAEAAGRARAGRRRTAERRSRERTALELRDLLGDAPFWGRTRAARRAASRHVAGDPRRDRQRATTSRSPAPASIVAVPPRRRAAPAAAARRRRTQLAEPRLEAASGSSRAGSSGIASAASTTAVPSGRASQRARRGAPNASRPPPRASRRRARREHVGRPLAAVGHRQLVRVDAGQREPLGERPRRPDGAEDALEASRTRERARTRHRLHVRRRLLGSVAPRGLLAPASPRSVANESPRARGRARPTPTPTDISIACRPIP